MTKPIRQQTTATEPPTIYGPGRAAALVEFHPATSATPADGQQPQPPQPSSNMGRSLAQILIVLVVLLVLVNIPLTNYRAGLIQLVPHTSAMVIYDGLLLQGSGPEIYVVQDYKLRWISSREAFERYFDANNVSTVEDSFLAQFGHGQPIRRLVRCHDSPTVYALENGRKRWVKEPPTNQASAWDRIELVACNTLRGFPAGLPVPEDAGLPPQP